MDVLVGTATSVRFELQSPTGTLVPDPGSLSYRIFDTAGAPLGGAVAVATDASTTGVNVPLPAEILTIADDRDFEKRTILVNWTSGLRPYTARQSVRVIPFLNMNASPEQVRSALGLAEDELADDEIDLVAAYFLIRQMIGAENLQRALASGTFDEIYANDAIIAQAALQFLPTLVARMMSEHTDGVIKGARYMKGLNVEALQQSLVARRDIALVSFTEIVVAVPTLVVLTNPTDVITGQAQ